MKGRDSHLFDLIAQGEHQQQDFKYKVEDAAKLARSVSAFANTDGGRLLIGVRDDGSIHGVRSEEEIFMMHAAAYKFCTPQPTLQFETLQVPTAPHGGRLRTVVICTVMPSAERPVFVIEDMAGEVRRSAEKDTARRRTAYVRIADENIVASPVHLAIWRQEAQLRGQAFADTPAERALLEGAFEPADYIRIKAEIKDTLDRLRAGKAEEAAEQNPPLDLADYTQKVAEVLAVVKSPDISDLAKNEALRSIIDKIIFHKPSVTFDIYFIP